jgi:hypothetical protein
MRSRGLSENYFPKKSLLSNLVLTGKKFNDWIVCEFLIIDMGSIPSEGYYYSSVSAIVLSINI